MAQNAGKITYYGEIDTTKFKSDAKRMEKQAEGLGDSVDKKLGQRMTSSLQRASKVGMVGIGAAAVTAGAMIVKNFNNAIDRVDTLNNSARTFANMGFSANEVDKAMKELDQSIRGLPTPLNEAVSGMQMITASTNDIGKSRKIFTAMNNAILGFGGSSEDVRNSVLQLSQAFAGGRIDAQTWNSMLNSNLGPALNAIARDMGITTKELKSGLSEGTISVEQFQDALIKMNEKGGGGMKSFEQISKDATKGIGTGWANLNTAITRGIADFIEKVGSEKISNVITKVGTIFEKAISKIADVVLFLGSNEALLYSVAGVIGGLLVAGVWGLAAAFWGLMAPLAPFLLVAAAIGAVAWVIKNNWDKISPVIDTVKNAFSTFWQLIKPIRDFIAGQFKSAWNDIVAAFNEGKKALEPFMPQLKILGIILGVVLLVPLLLVIASIAVLIAVFVAITVIVARVIGWFAKLSAKIWTTAGNIQNAVGERIGQVIDFFREMPGRILRAVGDLGRTLYDSGKSLIQGLVNGIKNMASAPVEAVKGILSKARDFLPFSPAKEGPFSGKGWTEYSGASLIEGLADGISSQTQRLQSSVSNSLGAVSPSITPDISSDTMTSQPNVNISLNMQGVMTRSKTDEREIARTLLEAINEELRAKNLPQIGNINGFNRRTA